MPLVVCPQCGRKLHLPDDVLGRAGQCPLCGASFVAESDGTPRGFMVRPLASVPPAPATPTEPSAPSPDRPQDPAQAGRADPGRRLSSGTLVVLILACLGLLATVGFVGFLAFEKVGHTTRKRIIGSWKIVQGNNVPPGAEVILEFAEGGKVRTKFMGNNNEGTYRINGDTLELTMPPAPRSDITRIISLSDNTLVLEDRNSKQRTTLIRVPK
jgi:uncharacterized protein (TIGR03066 family)